MSTFALEPIYGSLLFASLLVIATVAVTLWVTPPTTDPWRRKVLIGLRLVAATVLILAVLRPSLIRSDNEAVQAVMVVALDTSKSMMLSDGEGNSRLETQRIAFQELADGLVGLDEGLSLKVLAYDETTRGIAAPTPQVASEIAAELRATGRATDLTAALTASITTAEGQPIAGAVLFGDGTQTTNVRGGDASQVARTLDSLGVPLWTVPIGRAAGEGDARDVEIASLVDSDQWFSGNEVEVDFQVLTKGLAGIDVPVRLRLVAADGRSNEIAIRRAQSRGAADAISMQVRVVAPEPGAYQLIVEAETQDGEAITSNNQQMAFVDVRQGGGRVLYIEGELRQEYVFLRRSLRRFPDLDLVSRWIPSDTAASWPVQMPGTFQPDEYDVYILGDLPAAALGNQQLRGLADAVDRGAGLVMLGGDNTFGGGGYQKTPIADVLPIQMSTRPQDTVETMDQPLQLSLVRSHPITDLGGDRPDQVWESLPKQLGANRLGDIKVAPGIEVLLETKTSQPMLVVGSYGQGRVATVAFDSTHRWWREGQSEVHRRFWRQMILWLLSREDNADAEIRIDLDARRFATGASPGFRAIVDSPLAQGKPVDLVAEIVSDNGKVTKVDGVSRTAAGNGAAGNGAAASASLQGTLPEMEPGIYRLRVSSGGGDLNGSATKRSSSEVAFQVVDQSLEMSRRTADPVFLQQLANQTEDQGGRSFEPSAMGELLETIAQRRKKAETPIIEKSRLGDGPKTGWPMFLVFAIALSIEWFLRRRWNLA